MTQTPDAAGSEVPRRPPTPVWVKLFGVGLTFLVVVLALLLLMDGEHGPGQHL